MSPSAAIIIAMYVLGVLVLIVWFKRRGHSK